MRQLMQDIVTEALKRGIDVSVRLREDGTFAFAINGFYKSGEAVLVDTGAPTFLVAETRYSGSVRIESWDDLVRLNHEWWDSYKTRYEGWAQPDEHWVEDMVRLGLVTPKVTTHYV